MPIAFAHGRKRKWLFQHFSGTTNNAETKLPIAYALNVLTELLSWVIQSIWNTTSEK
jgi:hypothetical protein